MMTAHLAEDQGRNAASAVIGMGSDAAEISAYTVSLPHLRERTRVSDDETVPIFIYGNNNGLIDVSHNSFAPAGISDGIKKLIKSAVMCGIIISNSDAAFSERCKLICLSFGNGIFRKRHIVCHLCAPFGISAVHQEPCGR